MGPPAACPALAVKRTLRRIQSATSLIPAMPSARWPMRLPNKSMSRRIAPRTGSADVPMQIPIAAANSAGLIPGGSSPGWRARIQNPARQPNAAGTITLAAATAENTRPLSRKMSGPRCRPVIRPKIRTAIEAIPRLNPMRPAASPERPPRLA